MKVIITSITQRFKYIGIDLPMTRFIRKLVEKLKLEYDWFLEVKSYGGTIQGVLNTDNIDVGFQVATKILSQDKETTIMVSVGEVDIDEKYPHTKIVGQNNSEGFVEPGRLLDKLVKEKKTGIYNFEKKDWHTI